MKIRLNKKYSNKINESLMVEQKNVKPLFESSIDLDKINLDAYTQAFQNKDATDSILAEFKITKSLFEYLTLKKMPSNYDALLTVTNMPKKFLNINQSYDNKPVETIKKADDYASKYFNGITFNISDLTEVKPEEEAKDYSDLDSLMSLNEGPSDHGAFLFGGDTPLGDHRMNNKDLQNQHTEDTQKSVDANISNGAKTMSSVTTAIDSYIDNLMSSLKVCVEEFCPNGAAALKEFNKHVNSLKSGAVNNEKMLGYIKQLDQNHKDLENIRYEKLKNDNDRLEMLGELKNRLNVALYADEAFKNKCSKEILLKLQKAKSKLEFDNILEKAGLSLDESISYNGNNVLNEISLNEADESSENFLDIDEIYDGAYTILKNAIDPVFEASRDDIKSIKKAREQMEALLKKRSEEISNRIGAICRIGGNSKDIPGLGQQARTFLRSHPLRAEALKNIWANHETDLQTRLENRIDTLKNGEIMAYAEDFITNQIPRIIAMMLAYKVIARVLEVKSAHMSAAGVKKVEEIRQNVPNPTEELLNTILQSLSLFGSNITAPEDTALYIPDVSAADINTRYAHNTAAQFDLNGKLGLFVQKIGFKDSKTFTEYVNALNANIGTPVNVAKVILNYAEQCGSLKSFVDDNTKLSNCLEIPQDSLDKIKNYKSLLESAKIKDITDDKQIEGMKKLLAIAYKEDKFNEINEEQLKNKEIDRDKIAIVNRFNLAKLFNIDDKREVVSQIYENAREMQLADNFNNAKDAKDLMGIISTMTSLVNFITNKKLLEIINSKEDDSQLIAFFEYIVDDKDVNNVKTGITSMSGALANIPTDVSLGTMKGYLEKPDMIISDYRNIKEPEIKVDLSNDVNAKLLKSSFDKVYNMKFSDQNLITIANDYQTSSPEFTDKEKHEELITNLKKLMQMLVSVLIAKSNNEQEAKDQYEKILKESKEEVSIVDKYFALLKEKQDVIINNTQTIITILQKIYSSGKDFTKESVKTQEIDPNTAFVKGFDIEKLFKLPSEIEVDSTNIAINDFKIGTNATNAYAFVKTCIIDNDLLTTMKLQDLEVNKSKPSEVVKCLGKMIGIFTNDELLKENKDNSEEIKNYVNDAYSRPNWTFGTKDGEKSSIRNFIKRYVEANEQLEELKDKYEGDAKKAILASITLKEKSDEEFKNNLLNLLNPKKFSESVINTLKDQMNNPGFIGLIDNLFKNEQIEEVIKYLKKIDISEKDAFKFLYVFFEWIKIDGNIIHAKNIMRFIKNCMYDPGESTQPENAGYIYYGNQKYIIENNALLKILNEESKTIGQILTSIFNHIKNGSEKGKELFNKLVGNDSSDDKSNNSKEDNKKSQPVIDPNAAQANAEQANNVQSKMSEINFGRDEILKYIQKIYDQMAKTQEQTAKTQSQIAKTQLQIANNQYQNKNKNNELTTPSVGSNNPEEIPPVDGSTSAN